MVEEARGEGEQGWHVIVPFMAGMAMSWSICPSLGGNKAWHELGDTLGHYG